MKDVLNIRPMGERTYKMIPVEKIKVLNSRDRDREKFQENVRSIKDVGLRKPVVVNGRHFEKSGFYELVCGEGRFLAYRELQREKIPAEIIDCDRKTALLYSLVENIARVPPRTIWFAREVHRMHLEGMSIEEICKILGKSGNYVRDYIRLAEQGEDRLIQGVERGLFPMSFALEVAKADHGAVQNILMDAFDKGMVNSANLTTVRRIIELRLRVNETRTAEEHPSGEPRVSYSLKQLRSDIQKITKEKESFVREAGVKENRLITLLQDLNALWQNKAFVALAQVESLDRRPELKGTYAV